MIITVSGKPGSGKSTLAKILAKKLRLKYYSIGSLMRKIAVRRNLSLLELSKTAENDRSFDEELDNEQKKLAKKDNFVIDSRLGFYFFPGSCKVFLDIDPKESARRVYNHIRKEEKDNISIKETEKNLKRRLESEKKRYREHYKVDFLDKSHFDIIIDTTKSTPEKTAEIILREIKRIKK